MVSLLLPVIQQLRLTMKPHTRIGVFLLAATLLTGSARPQTADAASSAKILTYIHNSWDTLSRSMTDCKSLVDPKVTTAPILYLPAGLATPPAVTAMQKLCNVEVRRLPRKITHMGDVKVSEIPKEGLLYLPNRYVVPGGRFNEMYGWDSYFIILGLVHDHRSDLARGMVENFFYEIENYGAILNANRTYFFTRSQPPFLSSMIREVYEHPDGKPLSKGMARQSLQLRTTRLRPVDLTHPSRRRHRPRPLQGHRRRPRTRDGRRQRLLPRRHPLAARAPRRPHQLSHRRARQSNPGPGRRSRKDQLRHHRIQSLRPRPRRRPPPHRAFYSGDRAMRESGFDTSFRFGPFSGSTDHYAPVCLNSLLYKYERDMAHFATLLGRTAEAAEWDRRAAARRNAINKYLWNPATGMFYDYDFITHQRSTYNYITAFYPLWAGLASPAASRRNGASSLALRAPRRPRHERQQLRRPMGPPLRLGAHKLARHQRPRAVRLHRRRLPHQPTNSHRPSCRTFCATAPSAKNTT